MLLRRLPSETDRPPTVSVPARPPPLDAERLQRAVREILIAIGEDPDRPGLVETPRRVAEAWRELCAGLRQDAGEHLGKVFDHAGGAEEVVILRSIPFQSLCEHHLLPFVGRAHVAYLPAGGKVVGLSKLARTVDVFARRPQLQERLTGQIADALQEHLEPHGVAVAIEGSHSCMTLRGARKAEAEMLTTAFRGRFEQDQAFRAEITAMLLGGARSER